MATRTTTRRTPGFRCGECGWTTAKWVGRCGECQAWGTVAETGAPTAARTTAAPVVDARPSASPTSTSTRAAARPTGVAEFDRVLGGGLVPGGVVLVAGEPGVGKSTLLLDVAARAARSGRRVLYVSGEESAAQVRTARRAHRGDGRHALPRRRDRPRDRARPRRGALSPGCSSSTRCRRSRSADVEGQAGNVTQVREVAGSLIAAAKARGVAVLLVGHVTKDGSIAGPRVLEHLVDVVIQFEGDRHSRLRLVRAVKNRFGPTDEVGCFDLSDTGIIGLADPSGLFLSSRDHAVPGTCVTVTLEGRRPLVAEVQALVAPLDPAVAATHLQRSRRLAARDDHRRPRQAGRCAGRLARHLRGHRRRRAHHRAGRRPRHRLRRRLVRRRQAAGQPTSSPSARSGSPARCGG